MRPDFGQDLQDQLRGYKIQMNVKSGPLAIQRVVGSGGVVYVIDRREVL